MTNVREAATDLQARAEAAADAYETFCRAREAMNAARPDPMFATPAERALYDERYKADHAAEREHHRTAIVLAQSAREVVHALQSEGWRASAPSNRKARPMAEQEMLPVVDDSAITDEQIAKALRRIHSAEFPYIGRSTYILAAERLEALAATKAADERVRVLSEHLAEQITHAETRIQDGIEMGASVWRIALEDIVRENRAALAEAGGRHG